MGIRRVSLLSVDEKRNHYLCQVLGKGNLLVAKKNGV